MTDLKPCPFCGGRAVLFIKPRERGITEPYCESCDVTRGWYDNKSEAITAWNTRTAHAKAEGKT